MDTDAQGGRHPACGALIRAARGRRCLPRTSSVNSPRRREPRRRAAQSAPKCAKVGHATPATVVPAEAGTPYPFLQVPRPPPERAPTHRRHPRWRCAVADQRTRPCRDRDRGACRPRPVVPAEAGTSHPPDPSFPPPHPSFQRRLESRGRCGRPAHGEPLGAVAQAAHGEPVEPPRPSSVIPAEAGIQRAVRVPPLMVSLLVL